MPVMERFSRPVSPVIANGETTSEAVLVDSCAFGGFDVPADFEGANLTFETSPDNDNWSEVHKLDSDIAVTMAVSAGNHYPLPPEVFTSMYFRYVSDTAMGADRTISTIVKS